jgi:serine/threonine-protein kinase
MLRDYLALDAPLRERSIATYMSVVSGLCALVAMALAPIIGLRLSIALASFLALLTTYYGVLRFMLKRGWYHAAVPWVNVMIEVSAPSVLFLVDSRLQGVEYALTAPPLVIWGSLVALSGLRTNRALALSAGGLAALEYLTLYFIIAWPHLPPTTLVTLGPQMILTRAFLLACSGVVTAMFAGHLTRKAEQALAAVRERDWMGKYFLHERIGAGGMAEVFRATYSPEGGFEKQVALKRVLPAFASNPKFVTQFRSEALLCSRLSHPNIVQVLDLGRHEGTYYLAMEFVDGRPLSAVIDGYLGVGLPFDAVAYLGVQLAAGLEHAHTRVDDQGQPLNLIHRDVNPPNVLVSKHGEVKLSDFGIAKSNARLYATIGGLVPGKTQYMAPEQAAGQSIDARADLYALGLTLHEALTGSRVVQEADTAISLARAITEPVPDVSLRRPDVPRDLDAAVMSLLEKNPADRPTTAEQVRVKFMSLQGPTAPFPTGQAALARCVVHAIKRSEEEQATRKVKPEGVTELEHATPFGGPAR